MQPHRAGLNWAIVTVSKDSHVARLAGTVAATLIVPLLLGSNAWSQTPVPMNILQRLAVGGIDRMTTVDPSGESCVPEECPSEGQVFYVPASDGPGRARLNRFNNGPDHLDSTAAEVAGYEGEGDVGFPYTKRLFPGLSPMYEGYNSATGDHALLSPFEQLAGYAPKGLHVFGYGRFLNQNEALLSLSAGGVRIESNLAFGGALWNWTWNGKQFFSHSDTNRGSYSLILKDNFTDTVDESGDECENHAPIVSAHNAGATQSTTSVPLAFATRYDSNQPCLHPVVWQDALLGKSITLNFAGMGPVAKYTTTLSLPVGLLPSPLYHPISSLNAEFNRYWTYDAELGDLEEVFIADACEDGRDFSPNFGGIILSDQSTGFAMGIYGVNVSKGGSVTTFNLLRHVCGDGAYSRMDVIRDEAIPVGRTSYNAYMMTGTLDQVRQYMAALFVAGVK
jgi:hypothetical protein